MTLAHLFILLALAAGLIVFLTVRPATLTWLVVLLAITVVNEVVFVPYVKATALFNRNIAYNIFSLIDMAMWLAYFYRLFNSPKAKTAMIALSIAISGWSFFELYTKGWGQLHVDSIRFYEGVVIILGICYLFVLLKKDYHRFLEDYNFWLCSAVIIYHSILFLTFTTLMETNYWNLPEAHTVFSIFRDINNIIYYSLICVAFYSIYYSYRNRIYQRGW